LSLICTFQTCDENVKKNLLCSLFCGCETSFLFFGKEYEFENKMPRKIFIQVSDSPKLMRKAVNYAATIFVIYTHLPVLFG
jgi:hypothetical protein